jgi:hypothetical protein
MLRGSISESMRATSGSRRGAADVDAAEAFAARRALPRLSARAASGRTAKAATIKTAATIEAHARRARVELFDIR